MSDHEDRALELDAETMRQMVSRAMDRITHHIGTLGEQPTSFSGDGEELARSLVESLPSAATSFDEILHLIFDDLAPQTYNTAGPGYLAYVPGGGLFHAAVADLISNSINRYVGVWEVAPGLVQLETNVIRWFCDMMGLPPGSGGFLSSGGSIANQTAVVTARRELLPENFMGGTLYVSDQTHHSTAKAAMLSGFPTRNVRLIPTDSKYRIRLDELERGIKADREEGLTPFMVVANGGSTNSGAVDDLAGVAGVARRENLWFHVDAAYGGFFMLTERGKAALCGISEANSITLDPHKGLFLPYGTGCLVVRDADSLRRAHSAHADYLPDMQENAEMVNYCEISPELSRDFRGLRVWLPLKLHGVDPFRRNLDEKLDLTEWATAELENIPHLEILARPQLSLVAFALSPPDVSGEDLDRLNRNFLKCINARQRVCLTGTQLGGRFALRICILSFRTHLSRMELCLEDIRAATDEVLESLRD